MAGKAMSKGPAPQIATANALLSGRVVYFTAAGDWSERHEDAAVASDAPGAAALLARARRPAEVAGEYLADAVIDADGLPRPAHLREAIRTKGPTIRYGRAAADLSE